MTHEQTNTLTINNVVWTIQGQFKSNALSFMTARSSVNIPVTLPDHVAINHIVNWQTFTSVRAPRRRKRSFVNVLLYMWVFRWTCNVFGWSGRGWGLGHRLVCAKAQGEVKFRSAGSIFSPAWVNKAETRAGSGIIKTSERKQMQCAAKSNTGTCPLQTWYLEVWHMQSRISLWSVKNYLTLVFYSMRSLNSSSQWTGAVFSCKTWLA